MRLLVVDDSLVVRNVVSRNAASVAVTEVLRAEDGEQAVRLFEHHRPELVTMDLTMPRLDGIGAIVAIRAMEPATSILVISALNSHRVALEAIQRGACGFLAKPFNDTELIDALSELVTHARTHGRA